MLYIGLSLRIQVAAGLYSAIVRYFWIVKEDRSKDFSVLLPSAAFIVLLAISSKFLTFYHTPIYLDCRFGPFDILLMQDQNLRLLKGKARCAALQTKGRWVMEFL